jgi:thiol-disulfide isomerase/thioredoxin
MKYPTYLFLLLLLLGLRIPAAAQAEGGVTPLQIGDTLPALTLKEVMNHSTGSIRLADYRGRWLILDFWATWCAPCIGMFPKADSLEQLFEGELAFLPVTYQGEEEVRKAFEKRKLLQGLNPAIVTSDNTLRYLFPHQELPHYVWVDPQGVVRAVTGLGEIDAEHIRAVLDQSKGAVSLRQKEDQFISFGRYDRLSILNPVLPADPHCFSATLTGYLEGLPSFYAYERPKADTPGRIILTNYSLLGLYRQLYSTGTEYYGMNRVIYEVKDGDRLEYSGQGQDYRDWMQRGNGYCYELRVPPRLAGQEWRLVREDLDRLFPAYRARVEVRKHPVLALVRNNNNNNKDAFRSRGGAPKAAVNQYEARLQNAPLDALLMRLNSMYLQGTPAPLVNLTGYEAGVDLLLKADMTDVQALRKALQPYGLDLVQKQAKVKVLVIRDVPAAAGKGSNNNGTGK